MLNLKKILSLYNLILILALTNPGSIIEVPTDEPLKVKPEKEGGREVKHADKEIYNYLFKGGKD